MTHLTPSGCWMAAITAFVVTLVPLLVFTSLHIGYCYAISYGASMVTLFSTAAHAVYAREHASLLPH